MKTQKSIAINSRESQRIDQRTSSHRDESYKSVTPVNRVCNEAGPCQIQLPASILVFALRAVVYLARDEARATPEEDCCSLSKPSRLDPEFCAVQIFLDRKIVNLHKKKKETLQPPWAT